MRAWEVLRRIAASEPVAAVPALMRGERSGRVQR